MKRLLLHIGISFCFFTSINFTQASDSEEVELVHLMNNMQYFLHKVGLSITANNNKLAKFYAHELEEAIEEVTEIESYDNYPIGQLAKSMLLPIFSSLDKKIESADLKAVDEDFEAVINACNSCHMATEHGFIKIQRNDINPYLQSFE